MHFARACTVNRLRILGDMLNVLPHVCSLSLRRCYGVAVRRSSIGLHHTSCVSCGGITHSCLWLSAACHLQTGHCSVHSDAVTTSTYDNRDISNYQSEDADCMHSDSSTLHIPVLAKEVVGLILPAKGQVPFVGILAK